MEQPLISKHIRMKILRTPLLQTLITYSKKTTSPKKEYIDNIFRVWQTIPENERKSYKNILNFSINSSGIASSSSHIPKKNLSPILRSRSNKITRSRNQANRKILSHKIPENTAQFRLSEKTKTLAINLNKHKLAEDGFVNPQYVAESLPIAQINAHKHVCDCKVSEIEYQDYAPVFLTANRLYVGCRYAASDFTQLASNNIYSIISVGEGPNTFPMIRGGYKNVSFDVNYHRLISPVFDFVLSQNAKGNVLVCDGTGKGTGYVLIMAYLMKYSKIFYKHLIKVMEKARLQLEIGEKEESFLKTYDSAKTNN